jgi:hypothetical protein
MFFTTIARPAEAGLDAAAGAALMSEWWSHKAATPAASPVGGRADIALTGVHS